MGLDQSEEVVADMSNLRTFPGFQAGESRDGSGRESLFPTGPWSAEATRYATKHGIRQVELGAYDGWTDTNIEFLRALPQLEVLYIQPDKSVDLAPLYDLPQLKLLSLHGKFRGEFDFTRLSQLAELRLDSSVAKKFPSAFRCDKLAVLALGHYPGPDFSALAGLTGLKELRLTFGKVASLQGLSALVSLRRLIFQEINFLETLAGIEGLGALEYLLFYRAKRLKCLDGAEGLKSLKEITLTAVPSIESLRPLQRCTALEEVVLLQNTAVADGDLACLKLLPNLRHVRFTERAHYNAKLAEFQAREITTWFISRSP